MIPGTAVVTVFYAENAENAENAEAQRARGVSDFGLSSGLHFHSDPLRHGRFSA